jgi:hypothetical protein
MMPMRSWSYRGVERCIISRAQHASPKVMGQRDDCRPQLTIWSRVVLLIFLLDSVFFQEAWPYCSPACAGGGGGFDATR